MYASGMAISPRPERPVTNGPEGKPPRNGGRLDAPVPTGQGEWKQWMREFGQQLRRTREFLGLSQEQVAQQAGVSQGAVSRLETARGLATPLLVVLKIQLALGERLKQLDPSILNPMLRRTFEMASTLSPRGNGVDFSITEDAGLEELVRLYRGTPERHRQAVISIMRAAVTGLKTGS